MPGSTPPQIDLAVVPVVAALAGQAALIAGQLLAPCLASSADLRAGDFEFLMLLAADGLSLQWQPRRSCAIPGVRDTSSSQAVAPAPSLAPTTLPPSGRSVEPRLLPLMIDFTAGVLSFRRRHGGGFREPLARAVGLRSGTRPIVLDATAGLGRDGFILAGLGCQVIMVERHPVIGLLLRDGLDRARRDPLTSTIAGRITLELTDCCCLCLNTLPVDPAPSLAPATLPPSGRSARPTVIYLDPMYPHRTKSALVKKEMQMLQRLAGDDADSDSLLAWALATGATRVVVKRPMAAPPLAGHTPSTAIKATGHRFDLYLTQ